MGFWNSSGADKRIFSLRIISAYHFLQHNPSGPVRGGNSTTTRAVQPATGTASNAAPIGGIKASRNVRATVTLNC
jgi:hypothetical protein